MQRTEVDLIIERLAGRIADLEVGVAVTSAKLVLALQEMEDHQLECPVAASAGNEVAEPLVEPVNHG